MGVSERHPAARLTAALERASIRFADAALTNTEPMRQAFVARGASPDKITVVVDGSGKESFPPSGLSNGARMKADAQPYSWGVQRQRYWDVVDALLNSEFPRRTDGFDVALTRQPEPSTLRRWDALVRDTSDSDVTQLSTWAKVRRAAGFEPLYMLVREGPELVGGALILTRRLPLIGEIGYVSYGPMIASDMERGPVVAVLGAALRRLADRKIRMLFVQPPAGADDVSLELGRNGFRRSQAGIAPTASLRLDLSTDEDELFAQMSREIRNKSNRWAKGGVRIRLGTQDDVALLARLHAATAQHHGFAPIPSDYIANLYRLLAPLGHAALFVGEVEGQPRCAQLSTACGGVMKGRLMGVDRERVAGRLGVSIAVVWETIRWAKANGYRWFDFGGIRETAASLLDEDEPDLSRLTGPEAFKVGFGPTPFRYPIPVEMISSPLVRGVYDLSMRWPAPRRLVERTANSLRSGPHLRRRVAAAK
jgi:lipid II:glycine glycyltransferase (peptidoglycan interpeptide bridge formation enzyme)